MEEYTLIKGKKGINAGTQAALIGFAVMIVVAVVGTLIVQNINDSVAANTAARNVTTQGLGGFQNFAQLIPIVGTVLIAVVVISLLVGAFRPQ